MRNKFFMAAIAVAAFFLFSSLSVEAAKRKLFENFKKEMLAMRFSQLPAKNYGNGLVGHKFYQKEPIFVVNCVLTSENQVAYLIFVFQDDQPKGLVINLINKTLFLLGQPEDVANLDLLSSLTTSRGGHYNFYCGELQGTVTRGNFMGIPSRKIKFSKR